MYVVVEREGLVSLFCGMLLLGVAQGIGKGNKNKGYKIMKFHEFHTTSTGRCFLFSTTVVGILGIHRFPGKTKKLSCENRT
jgi:hypothetical protein